MKLMKKLPIAIAIATITCASATSAFANNGNSGNSQGDNNGQPFQALQQLIDENRALVESNQTDIGGLKNHVNQLNSKVNAANEALAALTLQVSTHHDAIAVINKKLTDNSSDIESIRQESLALYHQINAQIDSIGQGFDNLSTTITIALEALKLVTEQMQNKVVELEQATELNALGIDALIVQLTTLVAQVNELNIQTNGYQTAYVQLNGQIEALENQLPDLEGQVLQLQEAVLQLEPSGPVIEPCFVLNNTAVDDLKNNTWFNECVNAVGNNVTVVLKDIDSNVVYQASGKKREQWTYDNITSSGTVSEDQWLLNTHDHKIFLDNGDHLIIAGKGIRSGYCSSELGIGYVISIQDAVHSTDPKLIVAPFGRLGSWYSSNRRKIHNWSKSHEISWDNGENMQTCYSSNMNPVEGFIGSFEFYVY